MVWAGTSGLDSLKRGATSASLRGAHLAALRESGLVVESKLGNVSLRKVRATDDPTTLGSVDAVLIGVKLWDTETAVRAISPIV